MNTIANHIRNVINRESKDQEFGAAVQCFVKVLSQLNIEYIVVGSTAMQTFLDYFHRLPGDFDITLRKADIFKIEEHCRSSSVLRFEFNAVASKVYYLDTVFMHLIPDMMNIIDKTTNEIFVQINVFHLDRTEYRAIKLVNFGTQIPVRVPILEYMFCLYVSIPLDTNVFADNVSLLEKYALNSKLVREFLVRVPQLSELTHSRLAGLRKTICKLHPDLVANLPLLEVAE